MLKKLPFMAKYCIVLTITTIAVIWCGVSIFEQPQNIVYAAQIEIDIKEFVAYNQPIPITLKELATIAARTYNINVGVFHQLVGTESGWRYNAVSSAGAEGLTQLMPKTAKYLLVYNSFSPNDNLHGGARYFSELIRQYNGNIRKALHAYNVGPGNIARGIIPSGTRHYASKIISQTIETDDRFVE